MHGGSFSITASNHDVTVQVAGQEQPVCSQTLSKYAQQGLACSTVCASEMDLNKRLMVLPCTSDMLFTCRESSPMATLIKRLHPTLPNCLKARIKSKIFRYNFNPNGLLIHDGGSKV